MGRLSLDVDVLLVSKTLAGNPVNLRDQSLDKGFLGPVYMEWGTPV